MRNKSVLKKLYPNLTTHERFDLWLQAAARDDFDEIDRLWQTCPRKNYSMSDTDFSNRVEATWRIVVGFALLWSEARGEYRRARQAYEFTVFTFRMGAKKFFDGFGYGWESAGGGDLPFARSPEEEADACLTLPEITSMFEPLKTQVQEAAEDMKIVWQGFLAFCEMVEADPERLIGWHPLLLDEVKAAREILDNEEIVGSQERVQQICVAFLKQWPDLHG